jgi:hypothetical protein
MTEPLASRRVAMPSAPEGAPNPGTLEARASLWLKLVAVLDVFALALATVGGRLEAALQTFSWGVATAGIVLICIAVALGLDRGRPWASAAVRPLLALLALLGLGAMVVAINEGSFRVPFEIIPAIWAGLSPPDRSPTPRQDARSLALVAGTVGLAGVVLFGRQVFDWGGVLDVRPAALQASLAVDCGSAGGRLPPTVTVTYDWKWSATDIWPSGLDMVVVGWSGSDELGRPLYLYHQTPGPADGIYPGRAGDPSIDLAKKVAAESGISYRWGIDLGEQHMAAGHIQLQLALTRESPPSPQPLTVKATYVHVGQWRSDTAPITCTW